MSERSPKSTSLRGGVAWSLLSFVGTKSLTFLATLILARILVPEEFGVLAAVLAFITLLELISDLGMKATVIYESESGITPRVQTAFTLNLIFTILLTAGAVALAPPIANFFGAESETWLFRIAAIDLLLTGMGNIHDALLLRDMDFRRRIIPQLTGNGARGVAAIALALAGLGASSLVYGFIIGTAVWTVTLWIVKPFRPTLAIQRSAVRGVAAYGGWASALSVIAAVSQRVDIAVIGSALGARALGLYTVAQRVPELIVGNVTWNLSVVAFPALAQRRDRGPDSLTQTTLNLIRYSALFGMTTGAALAVMAPPLVVVLFGEKWTDAGAIMEALAIMYGLICIIFPLGDTFKALAKQPTMVAVNLIALPVTIGVMVAVAPEGVVAVAWARVIVTVGLGVVWLILITRVLELSLGRVVAMLRSGFAGAAGVAIAGLAVRALLPETSLVALVLVGIAACLGGMISLRIFAAGEYDELRGIVGRVLSTPIVPRRWRSVPSVGSVDVDR